MDDSIAMPLSIEISIERSSEKRGWRAIGNPIAFAGMTDMAERLRSRLQEVGMSQSELARRVSVNQSTIAALLSGKSRSSSHLHKIARELQTTPEYLTGESDDPEAGAPAELQLDFLQRELLGCVAMMSAADQKALLQVAKAMVGRVDPTNFTSGGATLHAPKREFHGE